MNELPSVWETIRDGLRRVASIAESISVPFVANLKHLTALASDYTDTSIATEYLSENEAGQLMVGLQENGFYTRLFSGELEFIEAVMAGEFAAIPRPNKLVYNIAQSGTGAGRKSLIPAFCARKNIPICNSDAYVVSLARHKFHVHCILRAIGVSTPDCWLFDSSNGWFNGQTPPLGTRLIAKACYESASIGLTPTSLGELSSTYEVSLREKSQALKQPIIVQQFIPGYEVEVPIIEFNEDLLPLSPVSLTLQGETFLGDRYLDYEVVEVDGFGFHDSGHLENSLRLNIRTAAAQVFKVLGMRSIGRVDFRVAPDHQSFYVTDVATSPHLTQHSSFAFSFHSEGLAHKDVLGTVVATNAQRLGWI